MTIQLTSHYLKKTFKLVLQQYSIVLLTNLNLIVPSTFCDLTCNQYLLRTDSRKDIQIANILLFSKQNDTGLVRKDGI